MCNRSGERLGVARHHERTELTASQEVRNVADGRRDDRDAGGHRLQKAQGKSFSQRREDEQIRSREKPHSVAAETEKAYLLALEHRLVLRQYVVHGPDHHETEGAFCEQTRHFEGVEQDENPLVLRHPAHIENQDRVPGLQLAPDRVPRVSPGADGRHVDPVGQHATAPAELLSQGPRHEYNPIRQAEAGLFDEGEKGSPQAHRSGRPTVHREDDAFPEHVSGKPDEEGLGVELLAVRDVEFRTSGDHRPSRAKREPDVGEPSRRLSVDGLHHDRFLTVGTNHGTERADHGAHARGRRGGVGSAEEHPHGLAMKGNIHNRSRLPRPQKDDPRVARSSRKRSNPSPGGGFPVNVLFLALDIDLGIPRGDAIHVRELADAFAADGHRVRLVTATPSGRVPPFRPGIVHATRPLGSDWAIVRFCRVLVEDSRCEITYERRLSPKISYALSKLLGLPYVVEVNGVEEEAGMQGRQDVSPLSPWKSRIRGRMLRRAAGIVAVTPQLGDHFARRHGVDPARITAVPNGVDVERFRPGDAGSARRTLGLRESDWICFVGNLVPWQGVHVAVQAMPATLRHHPYARLAIVGDGISRSHLAQEADRLGVGPAIEFRGSVPYERVPLHIQASAVCVAPFARARNEAIGLSPLKMYEYMACGRPVVASDLPGVREILARSGGGVAVPPEDPQALAEAVSGLLADPAGAEAMGRRGRAYAIAECTWKRTAERIGRVLASARGS